jgi:hypothetical protein
MSRVEVCHEQDLVFIPIKNEGGRAMNSVIIIVLDFNWKFALLDLGWAVLVSFLEFPDLSIFIWFMLAGLSLVPLSHVPVFLFSVELLCTQLGHLYCSETLASRLVDFSFVVGSSSPLKDLFFCRQEFSSPSGFIPGLETSMIDPASSCFSVFQYRWTLPTRTVPHQVSRRVQFSLCGFTRWARLWFSLYGLLWFPRAELPASTLSDLASVLGPAHCLSLSRSCLLVPVFTRLNLPFFCCSSAVRPALLLKRSCVVLLALVPSRHAPGIPSLWHLLFNRRLHWPVLALGSCSLPLIVVADCVWIVAGIYPGVILELPDQKAQGFLVWITLSRWFLEHICKLFGEIPM